MRSIVPVVAVVATVMLASCVVAYERVPDQAPPPMTLRVGSGLEQRKGIPLVVGQTVEVRFLSQYGNGRPAYQFQKAENLKLLETRKGKGRLRGSTEFVITLKALKAGKATAQFKFGKGMLVRSFDFRVYSKAEYARLGKQGISGQAVSLIGNFMPTIGGRPGGKKQPIANARIHVFRGTVQPFKKPNPKHPQLLKVIKTDKQGNYKVELPPGEYTVVLEKAGQMYLNLYRSAGRKSVWGSVRVFRGQFTTFDIRDTSRAAF